MYGFDAQKLIDEVNERRKANVILDFYADMMLEETIINLNGVFGYYENGGGI